MALPFAPESLYQNRENSIFAHVVETVKGLRCVLQPGVFSIEYETIAPMRRVYDVFSTIAVLMADEHARADPAVSNEQIEQVNQLLRV